MRRYISISLMFALALSVSARTLYLKPNANWLQANAKFSIYYFSGSDNGWSSFMSSVGDNIYSADVPDSYQNVIFVRLSSTASAPSWDDNVKWNQTADLTVPSDGKNLYPSPQ